jgi:SAM-dependent methyltransferase
MNEMLQEGGLPDTTTQIAAHQRQYFNALADVFDVPQPEAVMDRLRQVVALSDLHPGEAVLDVGTGAGVLIPLFQPYRPSLVLACDLAEQMLARVRKKHPNVRIFQCDVVHSAVKAASLDVIFMNAMFGNLADKARACFHAAQALRSGGRLIISHPEGRAFVDQLRAAGDLFIESLPRREEFETLFAPMGLEVVSYRDEPKLFVMVARKPSGGPLDPVAAYDRIAPVFASLAARRRAYLDGVDALIISEIPPGSRSLLDVGAGDGRRSRHIARAAGLSELTLLEPSAEMRRHWPADARSWTMRAEDLHSVAGEFDSIVCLWNVLGHIFPASNRTEMLRQFARLVSPRGKVFVDVNHRYNAAQYGVFRTLSRIIYDWGFPSERNGNVAVVWDVAGTRCTTTGHVFTHKEFCRMAEAAGLRIEKRHVVDYAGGEQRRWTFQGNLLYVLRRAQPGQTRLSRKPDTGRDACAT